jgi:hypothetical protein
MGRKLNPKAATPDIHWHPTKPEDVQLCREIKQILVRDGKSIGDLLRPVLQQRVKDMEGL